MRRLASELVGTFAVVLAAAGTGIVAVVHPGQVSPAARAIAPAVLGAAMIYALGAVSGAHFNPVVTVAFLARGVFPWRWVPAYVAAQFVGAIGAAAVLRALFAAPEKAGSTYPHGSVGQSLGLEIVLTALVVFVTLNAATRHRLLGPDAALATGAVTAAARFIGLAVSGASMNPARSLGPALVAGFGLDQWIYVVGPTIGALIAVGVTALCHGPAQREEHDAAEGDDNRGSR